MGAAKRHDRNAALALWSDLVGHADGSFEQLAVQEVIIRRRQTDQPVSALDTDCGRGELARRLAQAGASVTAVCNGRMEEALGDDAAALLDPELPIRLLRCELFCTDDKPIEGAPFDLIVCRRSLPFMPYRDAVDFVCRLRECLPIGGKIYISALGLHSDFGDEYPDADKFVQNRFARLPDDVARRYEIDHPVCLYSERDLFMLLFAAGIAVLKTLTTTYGNVKAVGVRL